MTKAYQAQYYQKNKARLDAYKREWHAANRDKARRASRRKRGMVNPTGELRDGPCEACDRICHLVLDHDHATGAIRGWLCHHCNITAGYLETPRAPRVLEYLLLKGKDMASAFASALANYKAGTPGAPPVNPPEAVKVLEEQAAPEVANTAPKASVPPSAASPAAASAAPLVAATNATAPKASTRTRRTKAEMDAARATAGASATTTPGADAGQTEQNAGSSPVDETHAALRDIQRSVPPGVKITIEIMSAQDLGD